MEPTATIHYSRKGRLALMVLSRLSCILLTLAYCSVSYATIFSCQSGDNIIFQDRPCPMKKLTSTAEATVNRFPLAIHESWFDLPEQAEDRAFCDKRGCLCGRLEKSHQGSLVQAVADALYLDGSWHRYETSYQAWLEASPSSSQEFALRAQMLEASCEIMMSQALLRNFADDVMNTLQTRARIAEERGFDVKEPCFQEIPEACAYYDSSQLLARVRTDAFSLRRIRGENQLPEKESMTVSDAPAEQ